MKMIVLLMGLQWRLKQRRHMDAGFLPQSKYLKGRQRMRKTLWEQQRCELRRMKDSHRLWRFFHWRRVSTLPPESGQLSNCPDQQHVGHDTGHFPGLSVGLALPLPAPWSVPFWLGKPGTIIEIQLLQYSWARRSQASWGAQGNQMRRGTETRWTEAIPEADPQPQPAPWPPPGSVNPTTGFHHEGRAAPCVSCPVMSNSLWPHGLQPAQLLCPWDSPGKNTGVGCQALLQGIFPTQG